MGKDELARYHPAGHGADQADELCAKLSVRANVYLHPEAPGR